MEENKIKNNIICISGQPVAGKGTAVKSIKTKLINQGFKEENIHVISTGHQFRKAFTSVIDFINAVNYDDKEKIEELEKTFEIKYMLENNENRRALIKSLLNMGKSSIDVRNLSIEELNNLPELKEVRERIDTIIDTEMKNMGKEINREERPDEVWLMDSRLAFYNIPEAFSVRLITDAKVAGERLLNDKTRGKEDSDYTSLEEAIKARENRRLGEQIRYKGLYDIDLENEDNYDLIVDTSYSKVDNVADVILECLQKYKKSESFSKKWSSKEKDAPLQEENQEEEMEK